MRLPRSSGILLHPTSLPGPYGVGDLGPTALQFVDQLAAARQQWWQVLPLGHTGFGDSPYQCFSAFAGNPLLVSPDLLLDDGLLSTADLRDAPALASDRVEFGRIIPWKRELLKHAAQRLFASDRRAEFVAFRARHTAWIEDYALFMALKDAHGGGVWSDWPHDLGVRAPGALVEARKSLASHIDEYVAAQFFFFRQWHALKSYAANRGVRIIGDIPIFVAYDSADAWSHPDLFWLDKGGKPLFVAGVPPDYFSATGQLWGNPLYRWDVMEDRGYAWWIDRMRAALEWVDVVRIDHFIGFTRYWEIPAGEKTAARGRYVAGPGASFLDAVRRAMGRLPLIAEDLGLVTPEVEALRDAFELPGMKVLQFAFGGDPTDRFLPHNFDRNFVVYTGTHDNDTTTGWFGSCTPQTRKTVQRYLGCLGDDIAWDLIRLGMASVADTCIVPMQDLLSLGTEARMNFPGTTGKNWNWRLTESQFAPWHIERLGEFTEVYGRAMRQE